MSGWKETKREEKKDLDGQCQEGPGRKNMDLTKIGGANRNKKV